MHEWAMQFQPQIPFPRAGPEKTVKSTGVETFQFTRMLPARDRDAGKAFIALYWEAQVALC